MSAAETLEPAQPEILETGHVLDNLLGYLEDDDFPFLRDPELLPDFSIEADE